MVKIPSLVPVIILATLAAPAFAESKAEARCTQLEEPEADPECRRIAILDGCTSLDSPCAETVRRMKLVDDFWEEYRQAHGYEEGSELPEPDLSKYHNMVSATDRVEDLTNLLTAMDVGHCDTVVDAVVHESDNVNTYMAACANNHVYKVVIERLEVDPDVKTVPCAH